MTTGLPALRMFICRPLSSSSGRHDLHNLCYPADSCALKQWETCCLELMHHTPPTLYLVSRGRAILVAPLLVVIQMKEIISRPDSHLAKNASFLPNHLYFLLYSLQWGASAVIACMPRLCRMRYAFSSLLPRSDGTSCLSLHKLQSRLHPWHVSSWSKAPSMILPNATLLHRVASKYSVISPSIQSFAAGCRRGRCICSFGLCRD